MVSPGGSICAPEVFAGVYAGFCGCTRLFCDGAQTREEATVRRSIESRVRGRGTSRAALRATRQVRRRTLEILPLESRQLLDAAGVELPDLDHDHASGEAIMLRDALGQEICAFPSLEGDEGADSATGSSGYAVAATANGLPLLASNPGATATIYLDFDGHFEASYGSYSNITTPAFDTDGSPTTYGAAEAATIEGLWRIVAEDYAPFNINVTTIEPASFANGVAQRVAIGGSSSWVGGNYGGVCYVNAFTNSYPNVAYVFPQNLSNNPKSMGDAASHELGHGFGLQHQSQFDATGSKVNEYYQGPGDGTAPIMGVSYHVRRGLWWYGTSTTSSTSYQDDLKLLTSATNAFGYRADDHAGGFVGATALATVGGQVSGTGLIGQVSDVDVFSFTTDAGPVSLSITPTADVSNLAPKLELWDALGSALIASAGPVGTSFTAALSATLAAGSYRVRVASNGGYGNIGPYTVAGTIQVPVDQISTPTNLTASSTLDAVALRWTDNATNETAYRVRRSADGGASWLTIAENLGANSAQYTDASIARGQTYAYVVQAYNVERTSEASSPASATVSPSVPSGLAAMAVSSSRVDLTWSDVLGETAYRVEISTDGVTWTTAATLNAGVTSCACTGLTTSTPYWFRVSASNSGGSSAPSAAVAATTLAQSPPPVTPSGLVASLSGGSVVLSWSDNATNESGYSVYRSQNGGKGWSLVGQTGVNVAAYTDSSVQAGKNYVYRVQAYNGTGTSSYSNQVSISVPRSSKPGASGPARAEEFALVMPGVASTDGSPGKSTTDSAPAFHAVDPYLVDQVLSLLASPRRRRR